VSNEEHKKDFCLQAFVLKSHLQIEHKIIQKNQFREPRGYLHCGTKLARGQEKKEFGVARFAHTEVRVGVEVVILGSKILILHIGGSGGSDGLRLGRHL
jgi:hypothetical protein